MKHDYTAYFVNVGRKAYFRSITQKTSKAQRCWTPCENWTTYGVGYREKGMWSPQRIHLSLHVVLQSPLAVVRTEAPHSETQTQRGKHHHRLLWVRETSANCCMEEKWFDDRKRDQVFAWIRRSDGAGVRVRPTLPVERHQPTVSATGRRDVRRGWQLHVRGVQRSGDQRLCGTDHSSIM